MSVDESVVGARVSGSGCVLSDRLPRIPVFPYYEGSPAFELDTHRNSMSAEVLVVPAMASTPCLRTHLFSELIATAAAR